MTQKKLTKDEILHLAKLSKIKLSNNEIEKLTQQLTETLSFIDNLNKLDTKNVEPTSQTVNLKNIFFNDGEINLRQLDSNEVFANTKKRKGNYFLVKKIL
ncbi:MAG: Asp-tRNA(Asn)/Glu-tRNA(Gln) amidotransferase subunit GatC [Microgenomates group bacterium]